MILPREFTVYEYSFIDFYIVVIFLSFVQLELMKEKPISIVKLMESKFQFCR